MLIEVDLTRYRRACYWAETWPAAGYGRAGSRSLRVPTAATFAQDRQIALELAIPVGPMTRYGLLGARYRARPTAADLEIVVEHSARREGAEPLFQSTVAWGREQP